MFVEKYNALCKKRNLSDYKVAKDTGIAQSSISDWKSGKYKPKIDKLKILADYFGVSLTYFTE